MRFLPKLPEPRTVAERDLADAERALLRAYFHKEWADAEVQRYTRAVERLRKHLQEQP